MNTLINNLLEIDLIFLIFGNQLLEDDRFDLKKEYNKTLTSLRKPILSAKLFETPQDIIDALIKNCGFKEDFAINKSRKRETYIYPRHMAMTLCRFIFKDKSLEFIGRFFISSDHATVLHAIKNISDLCDTDLEFKYKFESIQIELLGSIYIK